MVVDVEPAEELTPRGGLRNEALDGLVERHGAKVAFAVAAERDGAPQVLYNGHPLYRYAGDAKPGDTNGQRVTAFGAAWFAASGAGQVVSRPALKPWGGSIY